jgi:hypothetical protein
MRKIKIASIVLVGTALVGVFVFFFLLPARRLGFVDSAIGSLRTLNDCARTYAVRHPQQGFPKTLKDMDGLIDGTLGSGVKNHYQFIYIPRISARGIVDGYQIHADPTDDSDSLHFYTNETGVVRAKEGAPANEASSPL